MQEKRQQTDMYSSNIATMYYVLACFVEWLHANKRQQNDDSALPARELANRDDWVVLPLSKYCLRTFAQVCLVAFCAFIFTTRPLLAAQTGQTYKYTGDISLDLKRVPFSRFGSYMAFSMLTDMPSDHASGGLYAPNGIPGLYLRNLHGGSGSSAAVHPVFRIDLLNAASPVKFDIEASPTLLRLKTQTGRAEIYFDAFDRIRFRTKGVSLQLTPVGAEVIVPKEQNHWEMFRTGGETEKYTIWPHTGSLHMSGTWNGVERENPVAVFNHDRLSNVSEGEIDTYESVWTPPATTTDFESGMRTLQETYKAWLKRMPEVSTEFGSGAELAAYINWSAVVSPMGYLERPSMVMSKNWMSMLWSWDDCFNAMALAEKDPDLAWDQFMVPFDNQEVHGALPDEVRENIKEFTYSKPPIHGFVLDWMMRRKALDSEHLSEAYAPLTKWTEWYFRYKDSNHNGLPEYDQGNDSGWDNSTAFLKGVPIESPDLSSFLVLQMDTLANVAERLGKKEEALEWRRRSNSLLTQMLERFWKKDHFVAIRTEDNSVVESDSLLLYIPMILGNRLPSDVQSSLIAGLTRQGRFRTSHGFATEDLNSPNYTSDGYWRGPIWAPSSMLLAEGLDSMGQQRVARALRMDFCDMAQKSGMAENYDAQSGASLRDPAYTWTSSVYLIFAHDLWMESH